MQTQMRSTLKAMSALLISLIVLSGCAVMGTYSYKPYTAEVSPKLRADNGKFVVMSFHKESVIEVIDDTHYRVCDGYKWPGVTFALLPIPIPLPLRIPTGKDCASYEVQGPDKVLYTNSAETGNLYCCGFCPNELTSKPKFLGCGEWDPHIR